MLDLYDDPDAVICGNLDTLNVMLHGSVEKFVPGCETAPLTPVENVRARVAYAAGTGGDQS